ncbi:MAG: WD40 repeat domain-containing protein [Actinophytocola sp.]|uniref:WD40 repeat domain-containing protein n=1 Tax=Actinophytocola sp. TaxID=1872138 RepID=UPI003C773B93
MRWRVGCWEELRERRLWQGMPGDTWVTCVDCTTLPDGAPVAVCGTGDGTLQVWDLDTGTLRSAPRIATPDQYATGLICTRLPDGTPVAVTVCLDGALRVWDLAAAGMRSATNGGVLSSWSSLACTTLTDGTALAVTGDDDRVRFWDLATARPHGKPLPGEHVSPQVACEAGIVVVSDGGTLLVWEPAARRFRDSPIETGFAVNRLRCLRLTDGTVLAVAGSDRERDDDGRRHGVVRAWDLETGLPYGPPLTEHSGEINALACAELPDGTAIAVSVGRYGSVVCVNLRTGLAHGPSLPAVGDGPAVACGRHRDGGPVVVVAEQDVGLWSLRVRPSEHGFTGPIWTLGHVRLPDGEVIVTAGQESDGDSVHVWDSATGGLRRRLLAGAALQARGCVDTVNGPAVVTVVPDGLRLCDLSTDEARDVALAGHTGRPWLVSCLNLCDGTPIVITGGESVRAWRADTGRPYGPTLPLRSQDLAVVPLPDGSLIVLPRDDRVRAWDAASGRPYGPPFDDWRTSKRAVDCLTLPDRTPVAVRADPGTGTVGVWDIATGRPYRDPVPLRVTAPEILAATLLPDGTVLAAVVGEGGDTVELVDPIGGRTRHTITMTAPTMDLGFTAEHRLVVETYLDLTVYDVGRLG